MKAKLGLKSALMLLAALAVTLMLGGCRSDEVEVPPLTGNSGHRLFIIVEANPEHLAIKVPHKDRQTSQITIQLKDQTGKGVSGEGVKLRIINSIGAEVNIGKLSQYTVTTDAAGYAHVTYTAPNSVEQPAATIVFLRAILVNPGYAFEVMTDHELDLEMGSGLINGCAAELTGADFTFNPAQPVVNETVCFDASPTLDTLSGIVKYVWTFGDNVQLFGQVVCRSFSAAGSYTVRLDVQDVDRNCSHTIQVVPVKQGAIPSCSFTASPSQVQLNDTVNFVASATDSDGQVVSYDWNFGDGSTGSGATTTHSYNSPGNYTITLVVTDDQGNVGTCSGSVTVTAPTVTCGFTFSPTTVVAGSVVNFDASTSTATGGRINRYSWTFGDGSSGSGRTVQHIYATANTYVVNLTLFDNGGGRTACSQTITVNAPAGP